MLFSENKSMWFNSDSANNVKLGYKSVVLCQKSAVFYQSKQFFGGQCGEFHKTEFYCPHMKLVQICIRMTGFC